MGLYPGDFADLGEIRSVNMTLTRLVRQRVIRRVQRGVYEIPRPHPLLGTAGAGAQAVIDAIARRDALNLLPSGAPPPNSLRLCDNF